jgi:hypothetical protein
MTRHRIAPVLLLGAAFVLAWPVEKSHAFSCKPGCVALTDLCRVGANIKFKACKVDCRGDNCASGCAHLRKENRHACKREIGACKRDCPRTPLVCVRDCVHAARACAGNARNESAACMNGCLTPCPEGCGDAALAAVPDCIAGLRDCAAACESGGSASGAFLGADRIE